MGVAIRFRLSSAFGLFLLVAVLGLVEGIDPGATPPLPVKPGGHLPTGVNRTDILKGHSALARPERPDDLGPNDAIGRRFGRLR
jgi:hypothetical protein